MICAVPNILPSRLSEEKYREPASSSASDAPDDRYEAAKKPLPGIWTLIEGGHVRLSPERIPQFEQCVAPEMMIQPKKQRCFKRTLFTDAQRFVLMRWLKDHQKNPYPTNIEKQDLMKMTGLNREQINVWFTNNRVRHGMSCSGSHQKPGVKLSQISSSDEGNVVHPK